MDSSNRTLSVLSAFSSRSVTNSLMTTWFRRAVSQKSLIPSAAGANLAAIGAYSSSSCESGG